VASRAADRSFREGDSDSTARRINEGSRVDGDHGRYPKRDASGKVAAGS
jgi:hypothetical protein